MPILASMPLALTLRKPHLDTYSQQQEQPSGQQPQLHLGTYPEELFRTRINAIQNGINECYPSTYIYLFSLAFIFTLTIAAIATALALGVSDGKPWVLGLIVIMILIFVSKMSFLSRVEKANKRISELLLTFNLDDMTNYEVLYRLRPSDHSVPVPEQCRQRPFWQRALSRLNLGLPGFAIDLTTIDHIDMHSFQNHPASDPHADPAEIEAMENELPSYQPKGNRIGATADLSLDEALPPKYHDVVIEMSPVCELQQPVPARLSRDRPILSSVASSSSSPASSTISGTAYAPAIPPPASPAHHP
ncbi:hypothetical protein BGW38_001209 [Lunasporangiospora selenospora]|uniref:Uncharacterized protein n=1 Tax=Lunasporangiospora selenospora TaxID=979761 RepID=A0A9P6G254_9FUNG|nr:hypothetical protein BGW38_001209 [Lunasporangiospora selenospora]